MTTDELRAKFEKLCVDHARNLSLRKGPERDYWYADTLQAWELWLAAHASRDAEIEALQDALFQISVRLKADREPDMDDMSWHADMIARTQYFANVVTEVEALRKDAERYRAVEKLAHKETAHDRYGNGAHWNIGLFSEDSRMTFAEAIDAVMREESK